MNRVFNSPYVLMYNPERSGGQWEKGREGGLRERGRGEKGRREGEADEEGAEKGRERKWKKEKRNSLTLSVN